MRGLNDGLMREIGVHVWGKTPVQKGNIKFCRLIDKHDYPATFAGVVAAVDGGAFQVPAALQSDIRRRMT